MSLGVCCCMSCHSLLSVSHASLPMPITPQPTRAPALPVVLENSWLVLPRSSTSACTCTQMPSFAMKHAHIQTHHGGAADNGLGARQRDDLVHKGELGHARCISLDVAEVTRVTVGRCDVGCEAREGVLPDLVSGCAVCVAAWVEVAASTGAAYVNVCMVWEQIGSRHTPWVLSPNSWRWKPCRPCLRPEISPVTVTGPSALPSII